MKKRKSRLVKTVMLIIAVCLFWVGWKFVSLNIFSERLSESLDTVPKLYQFDERWADKQYGDSTIEIAGCAPTCLSMVISYLNQNPKVTPAAVADWSDKNGYYVSSQGSANVLLEDYAYHEDVSVEGVYPNKENVAWALQNGSILIINVDPGDFTTGGHFLVGVDYQDGFIEIHDPNSAERTTLWPLQTVLAQTKFIWAYK